MTRQLRRLVTAGFFLAVFMCAGRSLERSDAPTGGRLAPSTEDLPTACSRDAAMRGYGPAHSGSLPTCCARRKRTAANCAPCASKRPGLSPRTQFLPPTHALFVVG